MKCARLQTKHTRRRRARRIAATMLGDVPGLETSDVGLLRLVAAYLRGLARLLDTLARKHRS